ncbi:MAG: rhamnan synthesis F family protein [Pseudomonadota bacterium]
MSNKRKRLTRHKINKELFRVFGQFFRLPSYLWSITFSNLHYQLFYAREVHCLPGKVSLRERVVVYVVYAKQGLQKSHLDCLNYFIENDYAPIVISNLPLSNSDRAQLESLCWQVIERPNVGYDFGAYREGILALGKSLASLQRLVLINDSTWFPLPGSRCWLRDVEKLGVDFAGAASHFGVTKVYPQDFRDQKWTYHADHPNFHYTSYALSFSERILSDPGFLSYWRRYKLTNQKNRVVRRGEIGLSKWVIKSGYSHGETLNLPSLDEHLKSLSLDRLSRVASSVIIAWPEFEALFLSLDSDPIKANRTELEKFILCAVATQGGSYALAEHSIIDRGYPFLKKSPICWDRSASDKTLSIISRLPSDNVEHILSEAKGMRTEDAERPAGLSPRGVRLEKVPS